VGDFSIVPVLERTDVVAAAQVYFTKKFINRTGHRSKYLTARHPPLEYQLIEGYWGSITMENRYCAVPCNPALTKAPQFSPSLLYDITPVVQMGTKQIQNPRGDLTT